MSSGRTLDEWLHYQEGLHPHTIELGLERVDAVWQRVAGQSSIIDCPIIVVGGTNGKGSTVAYLEAIYLQSGYRPLVYTSPHIDHYNERVRIAGRTASDQQFIDAFEVIESCREDTSLSYFEYGTLAALLIAVWQQPDVLILEVGLGGRLDAVNILQHDIAVITNISLDHMEWLGDSREKIAIEKAGIARHGQPLILADEDMPESLHQQARQVGALELCLGRDFFIEKGRHGWDYRDATSSYDDLPLPVIPGDHQLNNAAAAICVTGCLQSSLPVEESSIRQGLVTSSLSGRFEQVDELPAIYCDVAHNPAASLALHQLMNDRPIKGRWIAVMALQRNREITTFVSPLLDNFASWHVTALANGMGHTPSDLADTIKANRSDAEVSVHSNLQGALKLARQQASIHDSIIIFGSFFIVSEARALLHV
jgi:dihydrofolate synthase/folylpolyglutamate synthase